MGDAESDNGGTTSTEYRFKWTMSIVAVVLLFSFTALVIAGAIGVATLGGIPQVWFLAYITLVLGAGTWLFGIDMWDKGPFGEN